MNMKTLGNDKDKVGYYDWNEKLKNGLSQVRKGAREILEDVERVSRSPEEVKYEDTDTSTREMVWVREYAKLMYTPQRWSDMRGEWTSGDCNNIDMYEKGDIRAKAAKKTELVNRVTHAQFTEDLYWLLVGYCDGEAIRKVRAVCMGNSAKALEAYRELHKWYTEVSGQGVSEKRVKVMQAGKGKE